MHPDDVPLPAPLRRLRNLLLRSTVAKVVYAVVVIAAMLGVDAVDSTLVSNDPFASIVVGFIAGVLGTLMLCLLIPAYSDRY
jgi:hypothetical protein